MLDAVGFWSSAIQDDWRDDGALGRLRAVIAAQLDALHEAERGARPERGLLGDSRSGGDGPVSPAREATFLIPVVTPHYLRTASCHDEFVAFRRRMVRLGYADLVFPIHYVDVDGVPDAATVFGADRDTLRGFTFADFRPLIGVDLGSAEVERWARDLAARILRALSRPPSLPPEERYDAARGDRASDLLDRFRERSGYPAPRRRAEPEGRPAPGAAEAPRSPPDDALEIPAFLRRQARLEGRPASGSPEGRRSLPDDALQIPDYLRRQAPREERPSPAPPAGPLGIDALLRLRSHASALAAEPGVLAAPPARPTAAPPWADRSEGHEIAPSAPRAPSPAPSARETDVRFSLPRRPQADALPPHMSAQKRASREAPDRAAAAAPARTVGLSGARGLALGLGFGAAAAALAWWAWRHHEALGALVLKWVGAAAPSLPPAVEPAADLVDISAYAPTRAAAGTEFLVQVLLHCPEQAAQALGLAQEADPEASRRGRTTLGVRLPRFAQVRIALDAPGLAIDEPVQSVFWTGEPEACQFLVSVPPDSGIGVRHLKVAAVVDGIPVGSLRFALPIEAGAQAAAPVAAQIALRGDAATRYARAFLSYASADRIEVLKRAQSLKAARIAFFQDVLDLDPGERWEARLYEEIDRCDLFLLFWSSSAARSEWVLREVAYAIGPARAAGGHRIEVTPVILEGPPVPPPPDSLRHIHFNDALRFVITAAELDARPRA